MHALGLLCNDAGRPGIEFGYILPKRSLNRINLPGLGRKPKRGQGAKD
jgi:hypothetical protein